MNPLLQCKPTILPLFITGVLACFGLLPKALAVVPPPPGLSQLHHCRGGARPSGSHLGPWEHSTWYVFVV